jgi:hypothetical protein
MAAAAAMPLRTADKATIRHLFTEVRISLLFNNYLGFYRNRPWCQRRQTQKPGTGPGFLAFVWVRVCSR